jgi:hypothetical protein
MRRAQTTTAKFEELKVCLLDQYANYTVLDARGKAYHVNSKFTYVYPSPLPHRTEKSFLQQW